MIALREFRPGDAPCLRAVFESAVHGTACRDHSPLQLHAWAPRAHDPADWAARMQGLAPFVAAIGATIVGYADVQADGCIDHFYVAAEAGGQGVGAALMGCVFERARALGLAELSVHASLTAQPFFAHFGFEVEAHRVVEVRGVALRNALMRRRMPVGDAAAGAP